SHHAALRESPIPGGAAFELHAQRHGHLQRRRERLREGPAVGLGAAPAAERLPRPPAAAHRRVLRRRAGGVREGLRWEMAVALVREMLQMAVQVSAPALNALLGACVAGPGRSQATGVLEHMRASAVEPSAATFGVLLGADGACAESLLSEMRARRLEASAVTYNAAIASCERAGRWSLALRLLSRARDCSAAPGHIAFCGAIHACASAAQWARAASLLLRAAGASLPPTVQACNGSIAACAAATAWQAAVALWHRMGAPGGARPNVTTHATLAAACEEAGQAAHAAASVRPLPARALAYLLAGPLALRALRQEPPAPCTTSSTMPRWISSAWLPTGEGLPRPLALCGRCPAAPAGARGSSPRGRGRAGTPRSAAWTAPRACGRRPPLWSRRCDC
ncbi:unnamed protein product, partial [Prorocentrum cordatum]